MPCQRGVQLHGKHWVIPKTAGTEEVVGLTHRSGSAVYGIPLVRPLAGELPTALTYHSCEVLL